MVPFEVEDSFHPQRVKGSTRTFINGSQHDFTFDKTFLADNSLCQRCLHILPRTALWTIANGCGGHQDSGSQRPSKAQKQATADRRDANARKDLDF
jgi:hypothetical protein